MTCVSPEGRITPGCTGLYDAEHVAAWKRIVDFVHAETDGEDLPAARPFRAPRARPSSAGKAMDAPLDDGNWPVMAAVADVPWSPAQPGAARR